MAQRLRRGPGIGGNRGTEKDFKFEHIPDELKGRWPELKIARPVNYEVPEADRWNDFLNHLGAKNYLKGTARSLGSMACTYVTAREFGQMFEKKYDRISGNRADTLQKMRHIARNYNQFIQGVGELGRQIVFDMSDFEKVQQSSDTAMAAQTDEEIEAQFRTWCAEEESDLDKPIRVKSRDILWQVGSFAISGVGEYGNNKFGLDLSGNEQLYTEMSETIKYFKAENFDTKIIDSRREPHLTIFSTFDLTTRTTLRTQNYPDHITLNQPTAMVSNPILVVR